MIGLTKFIESVVINSFVAQTKGEGTTASGLRGDYYDNKDFTNLIFTRFDPQVNFDFGSGSPDDRIESDNFSIRWTGFVNAPVDGDYIFFTFSDDGALLTVKGEVVVDDFTNHGARERSGTIFLEEGWHDIQLDYFESGGRAVIKLSFEGPTIEKQIIIHEHLASDRDPKDPIQDRNQFDLFEFEITPDVRTVTAKSNINLSSHDAFLSEDGKLSPASGTDELLRNTSVVFVKKSISNISRNLLEKLVRRARLQDSGIHGEFPFILPSRVASFRD